MFTSQFVAMINQTIAEKQQKESRFQYLYVMINSILFTLVFVIASILFIFIKLYFWYEQYTFARDNYSYWWGTKMTVLSRALLRKLIINETVGPNISKSYNPKLRSGLTYSDDDTLDILSQVLETYGESSAKTLEHMTHKDKPWIDARNGLAPEARCSTVMPKEDIKVYFNEKYGDKLNG